MSNVDVFQQKMWVCVNCLLTVIFLLYIYLTMLVGEIITLICSIAGKNVQNIFWGRLQKCGKSDIAIFNWSDMSQNTGLLLALILTGFQEAHLLQCIGCKRWQWLWLVILAMLALVMLFLCLASFLSWTCTPSYCFSDLDLEESPATERQKTSLGFCQTFLLMKMKIWHGWWWGVIVSFPGEEEGCPGGWVNAHHEGWFSFLSLRI